MISFKQFLAEVEDDYGNNIDAVREQIQKYCQPFLRESDGRPMFRGVWTNDAKVGMYRTMFVRKDRKPKDAAPVQSKAFNDWFKKNHGISPRTEGLFVTGNYHEAEPYGKPHFTLPMGEFKYVWGEWKYGQDDGNPLGNDGVINDTMRVMKTIRFVANKIAKGHDFNPHSTEELDPAHYEAAAEKVMSAVTWHFDDLPTALKSGCEITVFCDKVILVPASDNKHNALAAYEKLITP